MSQSDKDKEGRSISLKALREYALSPSLKLNTPNDWNTGEAVHVVLRNAVQDVKHSDISTRMQFISNAAHSLSKSLKDRDSKGLYFSLLGGARALDERGEDRFPQLQAVIAEVLEQGHARKPGALLISKLKESGLWDELMDAWKGCSWRRDVPKGGG